jgi:hypothetical protein
LDWGVGIGVFVLRSFMDVSIMGRKGKACGGGVGTGASRPNGIDRGLEARTAVVTKRMGRKRSPAQSNYRAERELVAPETERASTPNAKGRIDPKFPAHRRQVSLAEKRTRC